MPDANPPFGERAVVGPVVVGGAPKDLAIAGCSPARPVERAAAAVCIRLMAALRRTDRVGEAARTK